MTSPAELRAVLGDPPNCPPGKIDAYFTAIAAGAAAAPPAPAGALDRTRMILGNSVRESAGRASGKSGKKKPGRLAGVAA
jgi:hypothetical protein